MAAEWRFLLNNSEYQKYAQKKIKPSPLGKDMLFAFLSGGLICTLGQAFLELFNLWGFEEKTCFTLTSITLVFLSILTTAFGKYDCIAKYAGAGTLVPITGFANAVASPAIEFKDEGFIMGVGTNIFKIAGPVIVYGISTSILGGIIYYIISML